MFIRKLILVSLLFAVGPALAADQANDWVTSNLGETINSEAYEAFPTISKDGLVLYFSRGNIRRADGSVADAWWKVDDWDIFVSTRASLDAPWQTPQRLPNHINTDGEEHSVSLSTDGHWMFFSSNKLDTLGGLDIFRAHREDVNDPLAWGTPENLGPEVNTPGTEVCVIYHQEESSPLVNLYFVSDREGGLGGIDTWRIGYDPEKGTFSEATNILSVSSPGFDGHLDPEAGYVWSDRKGGYGGGDLYHSELDKDGNWLPPENLGPSINTQYEEQLPSPFDNGRVIFFPSDRPGGSGNLDIYVAAKATTG